MERYLGLSTSPKYQPQLHETWERLREVKKKGEKEDKLGKAHGRSPLPAKIYSY